MAGIAVEVWTTNAGECVSEWLRERERERDREREREIA
jgi:hypothetical protein